jgi:transcriptional regulator with PAS, ATPase and Fis domain
MAAKFRNGGQTCVCPNRVFVHRSVYEAFAQQLSARVAALHVGPASDPASQIGPMINDRAVEKIARHVEDAVAKGSFREDLYYRLNTVEISLPSLRERKGDIHLLFRKFAQDFSQKYRVPAIRLSDEAVRVLEAYRWPGNIRQLRNLVEQLCVVESDREINAEVLRQYIPEIDRRSVPVRRDDALSQSEFQTEREILYKVLFDMRNDLNNLKQVVAGLAGGSFQAAPVPAAEASLPVLRATEPTPPSEGPRYVDLAQDHEEETLDVDSAVEPDERLSLQDLELDTIRRVLERHKGRRKNAAAELGISERTLYRKIKQFGLE